MNITAQIGRPARHRTVLAAFLVAMTLVGTALAGALEDATTAYGRGDYATALRLFRLLADDGNSAAQFGIGNMYDRGRGVSQDYAEARKWYRKAADQGFADAQYNLGVMFAKGRGVPHDDAEAAKWFRKAADQGEVAAQYNLGLMYTEGEGVPRDYAEAAKLFRKAADQPTPPTALPPVPAPSASPSPACPADSRTCAGCASRSRAACARTFSRTVQSIVTLLRTACTSSRAMVLQCRLAEHLDGAVVDFQRVVEGDFIVGQAELLAALARPSRMSLASAISSSMTCAVSMARF